jgi:hypothetical protein
MDTFQALVLAVYLDPVLRIRDLVTLSRLKKTVITSSVADPGCLLRIRLFPFTNTGFGFATLITRH